MKEMIDRRFLRKRRMQSKKIVVPTPLFELRYPESMEYRDWLMRTSE